MKTPTSAELAFLRRRAEQTFQRMPVLPRREDGRMTPESRLRFELSMESILENNRTLGACVVLRRPSGQYDVFCHGTARLSGRVPVTEETCFRIASVSKLVMAFGVLALCERGALNLDEDLSVYLGYPVRNPHFKDVPVTLRMLLTHTAAIRDEGNYGTRGMQKGCTLRELLENADNWLNAKPGEAFHYSNGYSMRFPLPLLKYNAQALAKRKPEPFDPERDYLCAAGRLITDSRGMAALLGLLASHGEMGVLSAPSLDLMRAPQDGLGGVGQIGRGLNTAALPGVFPGFSPVGHQGVAYGMCAELFADPTTGAGVGVMTSGTRLNRDTPPLMRVGFDLLTLGFASLRGAD